MSGIIVTFIGAQRTYVPDDGSPTPPPPPPPDPVLDTETVTVGQLTSKFFTQYGFGTGIPGDGISNGLFAPKSNAAIQELYWVSLGSLVFTIAGVQTNAGWSSMKVGSTTFLRSAATFSQTEDTTSWTWSAGSNPFSGVGTNTTVVFE